MWPHGTRTRNVRPVSHSSIFVPRPSDQIRDLAIVQTVVYDYVHLFAFRYFNTIFRNFLSFWSKNMSTFTLCVPIDVEIDTTKIGLYNTRRNGSKVRARSSSGLRAQFAT